MKFKPGYIVVLSNETPREALEQHDTGTYKTVAAAKRFITRNEVKHRSAIMFYDGKKLTKVTV